MARSAVLGTRLNEIAGSQTRRPRAQVLVWNPRRTSHNAIANGSNAEPYVDISAFVESVALSWNVGYESGNDPSIPSASFTLHRSINKGVNLREGFLQDGVIVQVRVGDDRVRQSDWEPVFHGTFRGTPGDDPGTRADRSEGLLATAYGREENFLNMKVTTEAKPTGTDLGEMVFQIATRHMGLTQGEILIGALGILTLHETNQVIDHPALQALWECLFPAGKKPMFDGRGRLVAVDFNLDKPAARIYSEGNFPIRSIRKAPNEVEVNNSVVMVGQAHNMTKSAQESQQLLEVMATIGFFDSDYDEQHYFSDDKSQRADETFLIQKKKIKWTSADYNQINEFSGEIKIDAHTLRNARATIFGIYLALKLIVAIIDLIYQEGGAIITVATAGLVAYYRYVLELLAQVALAALLWSMQFIGRGRYQIHGKPYEFVYNELKSRTQLPGLLREAVREIEYRNDFISTMQALDEAGFQRLRREMVKNQVYQIELLDDPLLEVDDVIQTFEGDRYYITSISRQIQRGEPSLMTVTAWKVFERPYRRRQTVLSGYGYNYGKEYGVGL